MKKLGSVEYMRRISAAILHFDELLERNMQTQPIGDAFDQEKWRDIVDLAKEIKSVIGTIPTRGRKKADEQKETGSAEAV